MLTILITSVKSKTNMASWIFASRNLINIRTAKERLLWGFWDKNVGRGRLAEKLRRNWRDFIKYYNRIKAFDLVFLQLTRRYREFPAHGIYAFGVVERTYYDDQTPVWSDEHRENRVLYPWRVSFATGAPWVPNKSVRTFDH